MRQINKKDEYAQNLLKKVFEDKNGKVISMEDIHSGYTNISYLATFENGKKYQVRIPHRSDLINRANEHQIISLMGDQKFVYFDARTGVAIKEWIEGTNPKIYSWKKWKHTDELFSLIKKIHQLKLPKENTFKPINFDVYNDNLYRLDLKFQTKYLGIIDKYREDPTVVSHTDINALNIIIDNNKKLHLIDYEWCGLASDYWDYANFIREARLWWYESIDWKKYIANFNMQKLKNYIFVCSVFAYLWTWTMPQTNKIIKYRKRTIRQIHWYSRGLK